MTFELVWTFGPQCSVRAREIHDDVGSPNGCAESNRKAVLKVDEVYRPPGLFLLAGLQIVPRSSRCGPVGKTDGDNTVPRFHVPPLTGSRNRSDHDPNTTATLVTDTLCWNTMPALYALYVINKSGGLIYYKV